MFCPIRTCPSEPDSCSGWPQKIFGLGFVCIIGLYIELHTDYSLDEVSETYSYVVSGLSDQYVLFPLRVHFFAGD